MEEENVQQVKALAGSLSTLQFYWMRATISVEAIGQSSAQ